MPRRLILTALEPVDSDVDLEDPGQRRELRRRHGLVLLVIAGGGVLGALLRYQLELWWPSTPADLPWVTMIINITGSLVIGAFMVIITERWSAHPLLRPFFGTGVLGGYTTFSTYTTDVVLLIRSGHPVTAGTYLFGTLIGALAAVSIGMIATRRLLDLRRPR